MQKIYPIPDDLKETIRRCPFCKAELEYLLFKDWKELVCDKVDTNHYVCITFDDAYEDVTKYTCYPESKPMDKADTAYYSFHYWERGSNSITDEVPNLRIVERPLIVGSISKQIHLALDFESPIEFFHYADNYVKSLAFV
jgi:hypothetical protein